MEKVSSKEFAYNLWKRLPDTYIRLYEHLTLSDAGVELEDLEVDRLLSEITATDPTFRGESEYFEMLGWLTSENISRENHNECQRRLKNTIHK